MYSKFLVLQSLPKILKKTTISFLYSILKNIFSLKKKLCSILKVYLENKDFSPSQHKRDIIMLAYSVHKQMVTGQITD